MDVAKITAKLETWLPIIVVVLLVAAVIFIAVKGWNKINMLFSGKSSSGFTEEQRQQIEEDVRTLEGEMTPSYPDSQYDQMAETLYQAMNFSSFNDWFTAQTASIINVMKTMQNDLDVAKTVKAYGARQLHSFGIADGPPMGLFAALNYDQPQTVQQINEDWAAKGITYRV